MIYTIGESVLDIIVNDFDNVKIRPGGSMLNTAISLGRLNIKVTHVSYMSGDNSAQKLMQFLNNNGVNTNCILQKGEKTNLALAFLNENNDAEYTFYKEAVESDVEFNFPTPTKNDIVLFGSFFSLNPAYRKSLFDFLSKVKEVGGLIFYDPNFRKSHLDKLSESLPLIKENIEIADIVKASEEDFMNIFNVNSGAESFSCLKPYNVPILFYTKGEQGCDCFFNDDKLSVNADKVKAISTVGAGDTFSAGLIYSFCKNKISANNLSNFSVDKFAGFADFANKMAASVCLSYDNYITSDYLVKHVQ